MLGCIVPQLLFKHHNLKLDQDYISAMERVYVGFLKLLLKSKNRLFSIEIYHKIKNIILGQHRVDKKIGDISSNLLLQSLSYSTFSSVQLLTKP